MEKVNDLADTLLAQKLSEVTGVGPGHDRGQPETGRPRPGRTRRRWPSQGLSLEDVRTALSQANVNAPKGSFDGAAPGVSPSARTTRSLPPPTTAPSSSPTRTASPVRLGDVGRGDRQRRERAAGRLGERQAGGDPGHPAPAGREHHRDGGPGEGAAAPAASLDPAVGARSQS